MDAGSCELRRLWLREAFRGLGLGHRLVAAALEAARAAGHRRVELETVDHMTAAQALYADLGFREAPKGDAPDTIRKLEYDLTQAALA